MENPPEAKYEEYLHKRDRQDALREEFDRRQRGEWCLWKIEPIGDGALLQFKYPSDWCAKDQGELQKESPNSDDG
jgi:hypothetical protein